MSKINKTKVIVFNTTHSIAYLCGTLVITLTAFGGWLKWGIEQAESSLWISTMILAPFAIFWFVIQIEMYVRMFMIGDCIKDYKVVKKRS